MKPSAGGSNPTDKLDIPLEECPVWKRIRTRGYHFPFQAHTSSQILARYAKTNSTQKFVKHFQENISSVLNGLSSHSESGKRWRVTREMKG